MYFEIEHQLRYTFSAPVRLGRYTLRLRPISDANQHLHRFDMRVSPEPAGSNDLSDLDGNYATAVWFTGETSELVIETSSLVETLRPNSSGFAWQGSTTLPVEYPRAYSEALGPFRASIVPQVVRDLGEEVARKESRDAQEFTLALARELHERFPRLVRRRGSPQDAVATLERGEASCADLAVLYMAVARSQGFAARFVSGYSAVPDVNDDHDVYAWAELYIPGVAWRGFDPSTAQATGDRHVAIAAGALAEQAAPVSGTYAGRATSTLDSNVAITEVSASA